MQKYRAMPVWCWQAASSWNFLTFKFLLQRTPTWFFTCSSCSKILFSEIYCKIKAIFAEIYFHKAEKWKMENVRRDKLNIKSIELLPVIIDFTPFMLLSPCYVVTAKYHFYNPEQAARLLKET